MAKTFSQMTEAERRVNRERLRVGLAADWSEKARIAADQAATSAMRRLQEFAEAQRVVGATVPGLAMDSARDAADIYKMALDHFGIETAGVPASGYRPLFNLAMQGNYTPSRQTTEAAQRDLAAIAPNTARIQRDGR